ncbi:heavy-metal-associated domain-containing protein [Gaetbulibacter aquiaggeris]|uniref:Heavy-metal-associated domain-containing protein n=1 Tax=Gaetbulibacter aquiaggeris TaxID=1735373 RepID=A0ABW7MR10_9FLAO
MKTTLYIQNLKCEYCDSIILKMLSKLKHISNVSVKHQYATVTFEHQSAADVIQVKKTLSKIGYPPFGDKNNIYRRAKSYLRKAVNQYKN